ncbi:MAG: CHAP domain-containing protein [Oscillospiraceae bacterium]|jgi:cell wall-associated NlpC family hydrolase|nr:CHAP domain-containing protein [Oscillospiraceae bacterium]
MSGTRAEWKEILAIYAVKTNSDPDNPADVATMDERKKELLRTVFWDMNTLASRTESKTVTEVTVEGDGEDFISTETTVTKTILYIAVSHKTADEMAVQYGFNDSQKAQLAELLNAQYADMWTAVLYGIHNGSGDIVAVAVSQLGNVNGESYWSWYGFEGRVAWCATFVSWCANECGYIDAGIIPKFAACQSQGIPWFQNRGLWQDSSYVPAPGDIIFFDWEQDGSSDHVGIVESVEGEVVHTIEGTLLPRIPSRQGHGVFRVSLRLFKGIYRAFQTAV